MRRIKKYAGDGWNQDAPADAVVISGRDLRLIRAVVQKAEILRATGGLSCGSLWEALDAFNAPEKRKP